MERRLLNVEAGSVDDRLAKAKPKKHLVCETLKILDHALVAWSQDTPSPWGGVRSFEPYRLVVSKKQ